MKRWRKTALVVIAAVSVLLTATPAKADKYGRYFECESADSIVPMIQRLLDMGTRKYHYVGRWKRSEARKDYDYMFRGAKESNPDSITVWITIYQMMRGENLDLEIPGRKTYCIRRIKAPYLDLWPVWQLFRRPVTKEGLQKSKRDFFRIPDKECEILYSIYTSISTGPPPLWEFDRFIDFY